MIVSQQSRKCTFHAQMGDFAQVPNEACVSLCLTSNALAAKSRLGRFLCSVALPGVKFA